MKKIGKGKLLFVCVLCFCGMLALGTAIYAKNAPIATEAPITDKSSSSLDVAGVDVMAECTYIEPDNVRSANQTVIETQISENDVSMPSVEGRDFN